METKTDVIYARYSSELQRAESIQDQVRRCRDGLDRMRVAHGHFLVIGDEAVSGTQDRRPGLDRVKVLMRAGQLGKLVVTEQSRLTRGDNAKSLIKDVVFHGGRFISVTENIDTAQKGWGLLVGITEIHHSRSNEDTAERVRGGQEGRVLDGDGSAGDFPYGYRSEYVDPQAALNYHGRGPKPRKRVVIDGPAAAVVREVFERFCGGESISSITRWLTEVQHEVPRIGKGDWHHQHVRRILTNPKYVGTWPFGKTTTVRDSSGKMKQVAARDDQRVVTVQRPHLRVVEQRLWDKARQKLAELMRVYGMKAGDRKRGPAEHYRLLYPKTLLGGLIVCARCGSRMTTASSGGIKRMGCPKHRAGSCPMTARVPYARAEEQVLKLFEEVLLGYPDWLGAVVAEARSAVVEMARAAPDELPAAQGQLAQTEAKIVHLVGALAEGLDSPSVRQSLLNLERAKSALATRVAELGQVQAAPVRLPDESWVREELARMAELLRSALPRVAPVLREMLGKVVAEEVKIPGKKRGYARLRFRIEGWAALRQLLSDEVPGAVLAALALSESGTGRSDEFVIELGAPSRLDELAPRIAEMRRKGVKWTEIVEQTGLSLGNAYAAFKRWTDADKAA